MFRKILVLFSAMIVISGSVFSVGEASTKDISNLKEEMVMIQAAEKITEYFSVDENGNVSLNANQDTLIKELGISKEDADLMISITEELKLTEAPEIQTYGFVGVHLQLGPKVRKMNGWAAGAFAVGYVGWYAK